ncbi:MAG: butyrate kinase [Synergistaceae bacterium]|nr:butyrate kinase [Synergistaceae bacterium]
MNILVFISRVSATEVALYNGRDRVVNEIIEHSPSDLHAFLTPPEQGQFRFNAIVDLLSERDAKLSNVDIIITEITSHFVPPGLYMVNDELLSLLSKQQIDENHCRSGVFAANHLCQYIKSLYDVECMPIILEPVIDNEMKPEAALSGIKGVVRDPVYHMFSHRTAATLYAWWEKHKGMNDVKVVVAHLGSEISVGAYDSGRMVDCNSPLDGEGPFSPSTSGTLPLDSLIDMCYSGKYDMDEMMNIVSGKGGLSAYMDDVKLHSVMESYHAGNKKTIFLVNAMAYKVAREIGARAAALGGAVEAIVLTGPWANFDEFVEEISCRVQWIAPITIHGYDDELTTLADAAIEAYRGNLKIFLYGQDRK